MRVRHWDTITLSNRNNASALPCVEACVRMCAVSAGGGGGENHVGVRTSIAYASAGPPALCRRINAKRLLLHYNNMQMYAHTTESVRMCGVRVCQCVCVSFPLRVIGRAVPGRAK